MTESFHEHASYEKDRTDEGLVEVAFNESDSVFLQQAQLRQSSMDIDDRRVQFDVLTNRDGYEIAPYFIFDEEDMIKFADTYLASSTPEGKAALRTTRHAVDLGFLSLVGTLTGAEKLGPLRKDVYEKFEEDSEIAQAYVDRIVDRLGYELWVRLQPRPDQQHALPSTIMAKLSSIQVNKQTLLIVPCIDNYDGTRTVYVPEQLELGHPWLYVGGEYTDRLPES